MLVGIVSRTCSQRGLRVRCSDRNRHQGCIAFFDSPIGVAVGEAKFEAWGDKMEAR